MLPFTRGYLRNEDDSYRTRKKIHESGINETFESDNCFLEFENSSNLTLWHKFKIADLFSTPPTFYQLVEGDAQTSDEEDQDTSVAFDKFMVQTSVRLTKDVSLQVSCAAGPIRSQISKNFSLKVEFRLLYNIANTIQQLFSKKICLQSRMWLKLDSEFSSRRKIGVVINELSSNTIICNSLIPYQEDEELVHEVQIDLSDILIDDEDDRVPNGLVNLGVTCYMNSYLQTIFHLKKFRYFINRLDNEDNPNSFVFSLQSLFYKLEKMRNSSPSPQQLVSSFGWNIQQIFTQQDVQEFSFMFLDAIEKKCQKFGMQELINKELFQGISESFIKCKDIEYESKREEVFADIQLAIKGSKNLQDAIENYLAIEELVGDNAYDTEKFGKRDAIKGVRFKKLPKVLIFHLSRFEYDYRFDENVKVLTEFSYPEYIDMDPYVGERTLERMRRKSSMMTELNDMSQNALRNSITMTNGNGNGNGYHHPSQENESQMQCEPISLEQVNDSENGYTLFGVFVHFGQNAYSGHYEVYLKIEGDWYEFNDEAIHKTDFEEVKRQSFGGKKKVHMFDSRSFKLKEKMRDTDGHAYMLVYIRTKDYDEIVRNNNQVIEYPQNVTEFSNAELVQLEKDNIRRTYHKTYLLKKETFLNQPTGRGIFFHTMCNHDHLQFKRFKGNGNFGKFMVKKSATTTEIVSKIKSEIQIASDDEIYLFYYNERRDEFTFMDTNEMFPNFNHDYHQYIYVHLEKKLPEVSEVQYVPAFTVIKKWNAESKSFFIEQIKMLKSDDTMVGIEESIKHMEIGQQVHIFCEDLKDRRLDPIEEPRSTRLLHELLQMRQQSSINFVYGVIPENSTEDEAKNNMLSTFRTYSSTYELSLRDRSTHSLYYLVCKVDIMTSEVFQFIRKILNIENDQNLMIELNVWKNNQLVTVPENRHDIQLFVLTKAFDMTFEVKQVVVEQEEDPLSKNLSIYYHGYRGGKLNISEHYDFEKYNGDDPTREQIHQDILSMPQLEVEVTNDLRPLLEGDIPTKVTDYVLYEKTDRSFRLMHHLRAYLNYNYFVVPVLEPEFPNEPNSPATIDEAEKSAGKETISETLRVEVRITSKNGRLMLVPLIFVCPKHLKNAELFKFLEGFVSKLRITNPENSEYLEPEYIRRHLKLVVNSEGRDYDMEKFHESKVSDFDSQFVEVTAIISMDSFRNNIKINI
jgi:ubiquitin C-terminal hydrolase